MQEDQENKASLGCMASKFLAISRNRKTKRRTNQSSLETVWALVLDRSKSAIDSPGDTFFTSAIRSFLEAGFSLASGRTGCDLEPADSLSDSDWLSEDSELLLDSLPCPLPGSLPCSLSDWLPESEPEASSEAEWLHLIERQAERENLESSKNCHRNRFLNPLVMSSDHYFSN